jgi:hypothetical protein
MINNNKRTALCMKVWHIPLTVMLTPNNDIYKLRIQIFWKPYFMSQLHVCYLVGSKNIQLLGIFLNIKFPGYYSKVGIQIFESYIIFHGNKFFWSKEYILKKKKKKSLRFTMYKPHDTNTQRKMSLHH